MGPTSSVLTRPSAVSYVPFSPEQQIAVNAKKIEELMREQRGLLQQANIIGEQNVETQDRLGGVEEAQRLLDARMERISRQDSPQGSPSATQILIALAVLTAIGLLATGVALGVAHHLIV